MFNKIPDLFGRKKKIENAYGVLLADTVLRNTQCSHYVEKIRIMSGAPTEIFEAIYRPMIMDVASYAQLLPATNVDNHAHPGGLIEHSLDVAYLALHKRRSKLIPQGDDAQDISQQEGLWTYAIFTSALLHHIGDIVVNQVIVMFNKKQEYIGTWEPFLGHMVGRAAWYKMDYTKSAQQATSALASLMLSTKIIPDRGMAWLRSKEKVFSHFTLCLAGSPQDAGQLGEIVQEADKESSAQNLRANPKPRMAGDRVIPLHEKFIAIIRRLITEGVLLLNAEKAAGWRIDQELYLVSKITIDQARKRLIADQHLEIPNKNGIVLTALHNRGVLIPNDDKALWHAKITNNEGKITQETIIRVPLNTIFPNGGHDIAPYTGQIELLVEPLATSADEQSEGEEGLTNKNPSITDDIPPLSSYAEDPPGSDATQKELIFQESFTPDADKGRCSQNKKNENQGELFIEWIQDGCESGQIETNKVGGYIQRVKEGVLIVSPAAFRQYAEANDVQWQNIQKQFLRKNIHKIQPGGRNIIKYQITTSGKTKTQISGIVVEDINIIYKTKIPAINKHLIKVT